MACGGMHAHDSEAFTEGGSAKAWGPKAVSAGAAGSGGRKQVTGEVLFTNASNNGGGRAVVRHDGLADAPQSG